MVLPLLTIRTTTHSLTLHTHTHTYTLTYTHITRSHTLTYTHIHSHILTTTIRIWRIDAVTLHRFHYLRAIDTYNFFNLSLFTFHFPAFESASVCACLPMQHEAETTKIGFGRTVVEYKRAPMKPASIDASRFVPISPKRSKHKVSEVRLYYSSGDVYTGHATNASSSKLPHIFIPHGKGR